MNIGKHIWALKLLSVSRKCSNLQPKRNLQFTSAVTRDISESLKQHALSINSASKNSFDLNLASTQHTAMVTALQKIGLAVSKLPSDNLPDSVFIEDTAVIIKDHILITNPGASSRRLEVAKVQEFLAVKFPSRKLTVLKHGTLDGGDVLFTGSEIFVGISGRTNKKGADSLQAAFPAYPVTAVDLTALQTGVAENDKVLHLKSFCSMAGDHRVLVGGPVGVRFLEWLTVRGKVGSFSELANSAAPKPNKLQKYEVVSLPDAAAANCVFANNVIIRRASSEFPASGRVFDKLVELEQIELEYSELAKADGALTCCSLLL